MIKDAHKKYLDTMGIDVWLSKENNVATHDDKNVVVEHHNVFSKEWDELQKQATSCTLCALSKTRTNVVFGVGNRQADVMLIGEAPGANEDLQGEPFVGRAGKLLNAMLQAIDMERSSVYIANILKCRPPNNRDPLPEEVALCTPYLQRQIALIKPKVVIAVGRIAAQFLLNTTEAMGRLRGKMYNYGELHTPLFVIYHPAYLLRSPREKSKAYDDLIRIQDFLQKLKK